jgi:CspA family cold shock protein
VALEGKVVFYDRLKGYGYILPSDGRKKIYVHTKEVKNAGLEFLSEGQQIRFSVRDRNKQKFAYKLKVLD